MNWYYSLLDFCALLFMGVFLRYGWYRMRFFLHTFQQVGYKKNEYWHWLKNNWDAKVIPANIAYLNILIFSLLWFNEWMYTTFTNSALVVIFFILAFFWFGPVGNYRTKKVKKPLVFTPRVRRLCIPYILLSLLLPALFTYLAYTGMIPWYQIPLPNYYPGFQNFDLLMLVFGWAFGALLIPFVLFLAALITSPIETYIQNNFKKKAKQKLASMPHLSIIAITGSYGKTSTKFMLRDLLKERYNVCATPGSFNTPMGICRVINNDLQPGHQILILEMGARYSGNIQELCDIARPDVAIITNVGVAHLETFGSREAIAKEKGTLVDNLREGGVAILNADDEFVAEMGEGRRGITRILAGLKYGEITSSSATYSTEGMRFDVSMNGTSETFETRLLGAHNIQNLLLAIATAKHFGIRMATMAIAAKEMQPVEHRLELKERGGLFIIDDAFNSNPVGAKNAVEILSAFKASQRIIVTPGMVELGEIEEQENVKFGEAIGRANLDLIILVGKERARPIMKGIAAMQEDTMKVRIVDSLFEANDIIREEARAGAVILYENDLPDIYNE